MPKITPGKKAASSTTSCPKGKTKSPPVKEGSYEWLRKRSPSSAIRKAVNPPGKKIDPVYGTTEPRLEADHTVSLKTITQMKGFSKLSPKSKLAVANLRANFIGLGKSSNASKGAKSWSEWKGYSKRGPVPTVFKKKMTRLSASATKALQAEIKKRQGQ